MVMREPRYKGNSKTVMHRFIAGFYLNAKGLDVDHINRDRLDNSRTTKRPSAQGALEPADQQVYCPHSRSTPSRPISVYLTPMMMPSHTEEPRKEYTTWNGHPFSKADEYISLR